MARHKHVPKNIPMKQGIGWSSIEECSICNMRRMVNIPMGYRRRQTYSRWVKKEESEKYMLSWLWTDEREIETKNEG